MNEKTKITLIAGSAVVFYEIILKPIAISSGVVLPSLDYSEMFNFISANF